MEQKPNRRPIGNDAKLIGSVMTESEKTLIRPLASEEETVIEVLHFLCSYRELCVETKISSVDLDPLLQKLFAQKLVQIFLWSNGQHEFVSMEERTYPWVEYYFLATKAGLFSFHSV
jgi:hypothetical protein